MGASGWLQHIGIWGERTLGRVRVGLSAQVAYLLLALLMLGTASATGAAAFQLHDAFVTSADDLSNIDQVVWNSWRGDLLVRTTGTRQIPRYGEHLEPLWIAFGPLFAFWNNVKILILAQTVALVGGALPIFWLAAHGPSPRRAPPDWLAGLLLATAYLLSPWLQRAALAEVHAAPFAVAPLAMAFWYLTRRRYGVMWGWALPVLMVKEEQALLVAMLGAWLLGAGLLARRRGEVVEARRMGRHGGALVAVSLGWLGIAVFGIINAYAEVRTGTEQSIFFSRYAIFGSSPAEIVWGMLTRPDLLLGLLATPERLRFLGEAVAVTGGLVLLGVEGLLLGAPLLALNLLSDYPAQHGGLQHYAAPLLPALFGAAAIGYHRLLGRVAPRRRPAVRGALCLWVLGMALLTARVAPFSPLAADFWLPPITDHHRLLARFATQIPPEAPLSASRQLHPHLSHRTIITRFPTVGDATWALVDVTSDRHTHPNDMQRAVAELLADGWGVVDGADGYLLLRRNHPEPALPPAFTSFALAAGPPTVPVTVDYHDGEGKAILRLHGYDLRRDFWGRLGVRYHLERLATDAVPIPAPLLLDAAGQPITDTADQPMVAPLWLPPVQWQPGQRIVVETLPRAAPSRFRPALAVRLANNGHWLTPVASLPTQAVGPLVTVVDGRLATLGEWQPWQGGARASERDWFESLPPESPASATFGAGIRLRSWELEGGSDGAATLRLRWQASAPIPESWQLFAHVVAPEGPPVPLAQADHTPTRQSVAGPQPAPTTTWIPGEAITDESALDLSTLPPGRYRLLIGFYNATGQRLPPTPDPDGDGALELGTITRP